MEEDMDRTVVLQSKVVTERNLQGMLARGEGPPGDADQVP
jgi:hypothetical protein